MLFGFILTTILAWFLYVMGYYYAYNSHYLGIGNKVKGDFLSFGYLFSHRSIHFVIFIVLIVFIYYAAYYYLYKHKKETLGKELAQKILPEIKVRPIYMIISAFIFIFINIFVIIVIRSPVGIKPFTGTSNFFIKSIPTTIYLIIFILTIFAAGSRALSVLQLKIKDYFIEILLKLGIGLTIWYIILIILGTSGLYNIWTILISSGLLILSGLPFIYDLVKKVIFYKIKVPLKPNLGIVLFIGIIVVIFVNNFADLTRPIGVGWDDLTRYINYPKLLAMSGKTPLGNFGWPLLVFSGIGFTISNSPELGNLFLFANALFFQVLLVSAIVGIGRHLKLKYSGLLAAVIFLTTPMVIQQLIFDTKTDIGLTAFLALSMLAVLLWESKRDRSLLALSGLFAGVALGIKVTAVIGIITIAALLFYKLFSWGGLFIEFSFAFFTLSLFGRGYFEKSLSSQIEMVLMVFSILLLITSVGIIINRKYYKYVNNLRSKLIPITIWTLGLLVGFMPILAKNMFDSGFKINANNILVGTVSRPKVSQSAFYKDIKKCENKGFTEEVVRYIGFEKSMNKYVKLPWNTTMNTQIKREYVDVGFIALASFSSLSAIFVLNKIRNKMENKKARSKYKNDILILPFMGMVILSFIVWAFVGQSIPWYGMFLFVFILIASEMLFTSLSLNIFGAIENKVFLITFFLVGVLNFVIASVKFDGNLDINTFIPVSVLIFAAISFIFRKSYLKYLNSIILAAVIFGIFIQLGFRAYNSSSNIVLAYSTGQITSDRFVDITLYGYRYIDCIINGHVWIADTFSCYPYYYNSDTLSTPVYRIGTFVPYFIQKNDVRMFDDSRLDKINCLLSQKNDSESLKHLQNLGFQYLVYDTNSDSIEKDLKGPVHGKVKRFENWLRRLKYKEKIVLCDIPDNKSIKFYNLKKFDKKNPRLNNCKLVESKSLDILKNY